MAKAQEVKDKTEGVSVRELESKGLQRKLELTAPKGAFEHSFRAFVEGKGKTYKMAGFRPGKVPFDLLFERFKAEATTHALSEVVDHAVEDCLRNLKVKLASKPRYEVVSSPTAENLAKPFVFTIIFECAPDVKATGLETIKLTKAVVGVADKEVDSLLGEWKGIYKKPASLKKARASKEGDVLEVNIEVTPKGKEPHRMDGVHLRLTAEELGDELLQDLIDVKAGDQVTRKTKIPKRDPDKSLAGKKVPTCYTVLAVKELAPLEKEDELPSAMGLKTLDEVKDRAKKQLTERADSLSYLWLKRQILDNLARLHTEEMPESLVKAEYKKLWSEALREAGLKDGEKASQERDETFKKFFDKTEKEVRAFFEKVAMRRVRLGFVLNALAAEWSVSVTEEETRNLLYKEMSRHRGQEEQVLSYFRKNPGAVEGLKAPFLEDKIVKAIIEKYPPKAEEKMTMVDVEKKLEQEEAA